MTEFLPLCDVLFNVISLAGYFCDVVFDIVFGYALFERGMFVHFTAVMSLVTCSLLVSQIISFRWYWKRNARKRLERPVIDAANNICNSDKKDPNECVRSTFVDCLDPEAPLRSYALIAVHSLQCGVLWRYAKLFVPVNLSRVKHEVRDLCMLRLVHGFCEAAPMLLLQVHLLITDVENIKYNAKSEMKLKSLSGQTYPISMVRVAITKTPGSSENTFKDLNVVSAALSLFSVCWALASFSKNVRLHKVHRLVLTWLGVIFQFIWRLGTVSARIASLTVYASVYKHWVFLVIVLHWFSMLLWLISPKNVFHGERISKIRKIFFSSLIAFIYVFAYINLQEVNHRQKMLTFYAVMFLENVLLVSLWLVGIWNYRPNKWQSTPLMILASFFTGIVFMLVYYRYFHVRRLSWESGGRYPYNENEIAPEVNYAKRQKVMESDAGPGSRNYRQPPIAGVFNCRFTNPVGNAATKRKKKKPTTFIPPPPPNSFGYGPPPDGIPVGVIPSAVIPFWRRPVTSSQSQAGSSETEGSVGSRVNIHQKLQEKKQKQLAELKIIEEEIKQGKLGGPQVMNSVHSSGDDGRNSLPRQPIPKTKKHINLDTIDLEKSFSDFDELNNLNKYPSTVQYDAVYTSFGLSGINIPALEQDNNVKTVLAESNSLTRAPVHAHRAKIPHNLPRNLMLENCQRNQSQKPNTRSSVVFNHVKHQNIFLEMNHPRQISGTYSSGTERNPNKDVEGLPFPYNVVPPPRSKLDSRSTPPTTPVEFLEKSAQRQFRGAHTTSGDTGVIAKTSEILLAPHFLDNSRIYYDWADRNQTYRGVDRNTAGHLSSGDENLDISGTTAPDETEGCDINGGDHRIPSDIDSQVSLPRSYTLPREFKYYRRNKPRKLAKTETDFIFTSTNGSDGDVDSGDENESDTPSDQPARESAQCHIVGFPPNPRVTPNNFHNHQMPKSTSKNPLQPSHCNKFTQNHSPLRQNDRIREGSPQLAASIAVNNLDLINGVGGSATGIPSFSNFSNRSRMRAFGLAKHTVGHLPYSRHETKL